MEWVEITREEFLELYSKLGIAQTTIGHSPCYMELTYPDGSGLKRVVRWSREDEYYKRGGEQ